MIFYNCLQKYLNFRQDFLRVMSSSTVINSMEKCHPLSLLGPNNIFGIEEVNSIGNSQRVGSQTY